MEDYLELPDFTWSSKLEVLQEPQDTVAYEQTRISCKNALQHSSMHVNFQQDHIRPGKVVLR